MLLGRKGIQLWWDWEGRRQISEDNQSREGDVTTEFTNPEQIIH